MIRAYQLTLVSFTKRFFISFIEFIMDVLGKSTYSSNSFVIVHPIYDVPEEKCDVDKVGKMKLSKGGRLSLLVLRFYLIGMLALAIYRTLVLANAI